MNGEKTTKSSQKSSADWDVITLVDGSAQPIILFLRFQLIARTLLFNARITCVKVVADAQFDTLVVSPGGEAGQTPSGTRLTGLKLKASLPNWIPGLTADPGERGKRLLQTPDSSSHSAHLHWCCSVHNVFSPCVETRPGVGRGGGVEPQ